MRNKFVAGNWKMHGTCKEVSALIKEISNGLSDFSDAKVAVFPSFIHLPLVYELLKDTELAFGAQNINEHESGAYTGEVSGAMLNDIGCGYVLVGHSERRQSYGESNEVVAEKFSAAKTNDLTPVLCVGETKDQRDAGETEKVVQDQIEAVIAKSSIGSFSKAVIAYEPIWAIGTGLTATPEQAQSVHAFIRNYIAKQSSDIAENLQIIYGGSVKSDNAKDLFAMPDIDGGLVGGASLKAQDFITICKSIL